jgi:hypothetical protein
MTSVARRLEPRRDLRALYDDAFAAYVRLYPAIRPVLAGARQ